MEVAIEGPVGSWYEEGLFVVRILITEDLAPMLCMMTPIVHPFIIGDGSIIITDGAYIPSSLMAATDDRLSTLQMASGWRSQRR